MKVTYNAAEDVLQIRLGSVPLENNDKENQGIVLDYDEKGNLSGVDIQMLPKK